MNIKELISSTNLVPNREQSRVFQKKFGNIYLYNQTVKTKKNSSIVEVSMMVGAVTDKVTALGGGKRASAAHKVVISIRGVEHQFLTAESLVSLIRFTDKTYANEEDFPSPDLLDMAVKNSVKFFEGKTIFATSDGEGFNLVSDKIPETSDIRVWCSCSDYYWTFQFYNVENKVDIYGKYPARYVPKTKKGFEAFKKNQPLRNPGRHPGMCKHLMLLLAMLMEKGVVKDSNGALKDYLKADYNKFKKEQRLSESQYNKLMKEYEADHNKVVRQRDANRYDYGYGNSIDSKKTGWNRKTLTWNDNTGRWNKRKGS